MLQQQFSALELKFIEILKYILSVDKLKITNFVNILILRLSCI